MDTNANVQRSISPSGKKLAWTYRPGREDLPTLVSLHGFLSDMAGTKAVFLDAFCEKNDQAFLRFDCSGHGQSGGTLEEGSISLWLEEALFMIDTQAKGPVLLVGSSMGGWIGLLATEARPERVMGLIGIAAAPDFSDTIWEERMSKKEREECLKEGKINLPPALDEKMRSLTHHFFEDGRKNSLFRRNSPLRIAAPVTLLQGKQDADVPWRTAEKILGLLPRKNGNAVYIEGGDHRLSRPEDLEKLGAAVAQMTGRIGATEKTDYFRR